MIRSRRAWTVRMLLLAAAAAVIPACKKKSDDGVLFVPVPGSLGFSAATYAVAEEGGTATITVTRSGGTLGPVNVTYGTSNGSATGADYTPAAGMLFWADGEGGDKTFTVAVTGDVLSEGDETVNLALSLLSGGASPGLSAAVLTITDNDSPGGTGVLQYESATYTVDEGAGSLVITVTRTGGSTGPASATVAGAGNVADWSIASPGVSWAAGETGPKTVTMTIVDDALGEAAETVNLSLTGLTGATAGTQATSVVTITDNDSPGTLALSSAATSSNESGGSATITVTRTGGSGGAVTVNFATADGTATLAGSDYGTASGTLSWGNGETGPKTFTVSLADDAVVEADETVNLSISGPTGGAALGLAAATLTIVNDDTSLQFSAATYSVAESGPTATITATRLGTTVGAVGVTWATSDGTALAASDYTAGTNTLAWANGDGAAKTFTVAITNDALSEGSETVSLALSAPTGGGAVLGAQSTAVLTILDNPGVVQFSAATYSVNEAGPSVTITATRTQGRGGAATATYGVNGGAPGTATSGADYAIVGTTLNWADQDGADKTFTVTITNDTAVEGNETAGLLISGATGASVGAQSTAVLTIVDNDVSVQYALSAQSVNEAAGPLVVTATRLGTSVGQVTVSYTYVDQTASYLTDYTYAPVTITWPDGDMTDKTYNVAITNDLIVEGAETFQLSLVSPAATMGTQATVGTPGTTTITIIDDDSPGVIEFQATASTTAEGAAASAITATRTAGSGNAVTATYAVSVSSTAGASEYTLTGTLSWAAGDNAPKTLTFTPAANDGSSEGTETVVINLTGTTGGATLGTNTTHTVSIADSPGVIQFTAAAYSQQEANSGSVTANITVSRTGGRGGAVGIQFSAAAGGATPATAGTDFTAVTNSPYTWPDNIDTDYTFTVTILGDGTIESTETAALSLGGVSGGATIGAQGTATLSIVDSPGVLDFTLTGYTADEPNTGNVTANVVVRRTVGSGGAVGATVADAGTGTGTSGTDYSAISGGVSLGAGVTNQNFAVTVLSDGAIEFGGKTLVLNLTTPTGSAAISGNTSTTLTINDSPGSIVFTSAPYTVAEPAASGQQTITMSRVAGSGGQVTVTLSSGAAGDTAQSSAPADFTAVPAATTFTWNTGITGNQTHNVPILSDSLSEGNEFFTVTLSNPVGGVALPSPTTTVTITDSPGVLRFVQASYLGNVEGGAAFNVQVERVNGRGGAASVNYSAPASADYTLGGTGTLTWLNNDATTQNILVTLNEDADVATETFTITLGGASGASIGVPGATDVQMVDNDTSVEIAQAAYPVTESNTVGVTVSIQVNRTGNLTGSITVPFSVNNVSTVGADYTVNTASPLSFAASETTKTISITIANDLTIEPTESFTVTLGPGQLPAATTFIGTIGSTTVTITDSPGVIEFVSLNSSVGEASGTVSVQVRRVFGSGGAVSTMVAAADGTATQGAGFDYGAISTSLPLIWSAGDTTTVYDLILPIIEDALGEGDETFTLSLNTPTGNVSLSAGIHTVTIQDNEASYRFLAATYQGSEAAPGLVSVTIVRDGPAPASAVDVGWTLDVANGSLGLTGPGAAPANDFNTPSGLATGTVSFATTDLSKTFDIQVNDDALGEGTEILPMFITIVAGPGVLGTQVSADFLILDNEQTVQFSQATYTFTEGAGTVNLVVTRTGNPSGALTVEANFIPGSASNPGDYTTPLGDPQVLTWIDGDSTSRNVQLTIVNDSQFENQESLTVQLGVTSGTASLGTPGTATVQIDSNDTELVFTGISQSVGEGAGSVTVSVTRLGGVGPVSVTYGPDSVSPGDASTPADYSLVGTALTWNDGETGAKTFTITLIDDSVAESSGSEFIFLRLTNAVFTSPTPNATVYIGAQATTTVQIDENETAVQFFFPSGTVNESASPASVQVVRVGSTAGVVTVQCATTTVGSTAQDGPDYTANSQTLTWNGVGGSQFFTFPINDDFAVEGNETVNVVLSAFTSSVVPGQINPGGHTVTIVDDPVGSIEFTSATFGVTEGTPTLGISATRTGGSEGPASVTVSLSGTPGSALSGTDYSGLPFTLNWGAGVGGVQSSALQITNDSTVESPETINMVLGSVSGAALGGLTSATATINDNDTGFRFTSSGQTGAENALGTVTLTVERVGSTVGAVQVDLVVTGGDASGSGPGQDYQFTSPFTLMWADGDSTNKTMGVQIFGDTNSEGTETLILGMQNFTAGTSILTPPSNFTITITNDDGPNATALTPINASNGVGLGANLLVRFTEPMNQASVQNNTTVNAVPAHVVPIQLNYYWNTAGDEVTIAFDTTTPAGQETDDLLNPATQYTVTIDTDAIGLTTGLNMGSNFVTVFNTRTDVLAPTIQSISSTVGGIATGQDPRTTLLTGSVDGFDIVVTDLADITTTWGQSWISTQAQEWQDMIENPGPQVDNGMGGPDGMIVTWDAGTATTATFQIRFTSMTLLPRTLYRVSFGNISDTAGNYMDWNQGFVAVVQGPELPTAAPTVSGSAPFNGQTGVARDTGLFVGFSETMAPGVETQVELTLQPAGTPIPFTAYYDGYFAGVSIEPTGLLPNNSNVRIRILTGAKDAANNFVAAPIDITFSTENDTSSLAIAIDPDYSSIKPNNGAATEMRVDRYGGGFFFARFAASGTRAFVRNSTLVAENFNLVESDTNAPVKGYRLMQWDSLSAVQLRPVDNIGSPYGTSFGQGLLGDTEHVLSFSSGILGTKGGALAAATHKFKTAGPQASWRGGGMGDQNTRPMLNDDVEVFYISNPGGRTVEFQLNASNNNNMVSPWSESVTINSSNLPGTFTDSGSVSTGNPGNTWIDYNYPPDPAPLNEPGLTTAGNQVMTTVVGDSLAGNETSIKSNGYIFATFPTPTVTKPGLPTNPRFNWSTVPAETQALLIQVELDLGAGNRVTVGQWLVNRGATASGFFDLPADQPLVNGNYFFGISALKFETNAIGRDQGEGQNEVGFTVP